MDEALENTPQQLIDTLSPLLCNLGFWRFPHMSYFVRARGDVRDIIGWRKDAQSGQYAVFFGVWVSEFEPDLSPKHIDETSHIQNMSLMHDLSLASAHQLSHWWGEGQDHARQTFLIRQILQVALPYFDTFASVGDVAEMVFYDPRFHNTDLEHRLMGNAFSSFFNYELEQASEEVVATLKPLQKLTPAFQYSGGYYWRRYLNGVFHVVVPHFLAAWRFVQIQVVAWHPSLDSMEDIPQALPAGFSRVAWRSFNAQGKDASNLPPAFLGNSEHRFVGIEDQIEGLRSYGLGWLENIRTTQDVYAAIRPEYKKFYPD